MGRPVTRIYEVRTCAQAQARGRPPQRRLVRAPMSHSTHRTRLSSAASSPASSAGEPPAAPRPTVQVDVTSDFACPWCYVGYMRLRNAIARVRDEMDVVVQWRPYLIDPATHANGEDYVAYNRRRWGGDGWVAGMKDDALPDGCRFERWGRQNPNSVWANTLHAHRMMEYVEATGGVAAADAAHEVVFRAYYERGWNISLVPVLVEVGRTHLELDAGFARYMASNDGTDAVLRWDRRAKAAGLRGVPDFAVGGVGDVHGAQSTGRWVEVLRQAAQRERERDPRHVDA